jgi:GMP synthase-like glutamine amidotransferase
MIGFLNAYHFDQTPGSYQEKYAPIFLKYLQKIMPQETIRTYEVAQGLLPQNVNECKAWIIGGSPASAYDHDKWILDLEKFTLLCHENKKKVLGICFGHQLIAKAIGGKVENSDKGWGVGVREFSISPKVTWMEEPKLETCSLLFSHQDQVLELPKEATILGQDDFCKIQMYSVGEHIFSIQGHPEFTIDYAKERYDSRKDKITSTVYEKAISSLSVPTDEVVIGQWIANFFNQT